MQLKDVMSPSVVSVDADDSVSEAVRKMSEENVVFAPVVLEDVCCGVVTSHDILTRAIAEGRDLDRTAVAEIMSRSAGSTPGAESHMNARLLSLPEDAEVEEAARVMDEQHVDHLAVRNEAFEVVGIVSRGDVNGA